MPKIKVVFEISVADGRLIDPSDPNNYDLVMVDAIRESGQTWDVELNESGIPGEYSYEPVVVVEPS